ncbi:ABC transporter ATP-binding protein [Vallitalea pronyensis]|uniref:ABC transporter ATP-binding protein n=1 Tax=Vallitalea pronyensis TaxID=1348613 RepID=A0A8J8SGB4_9FIRM|nr:ABC transporter ATP-binding protein [Vallitalea pronyensis]QUI22421.1 ABC transporter ATP-binding protein [Vallitalea pronyensis]
MIRLQNIVFSYNEKPFIDELSLHIKKGEILSIVGPNGSGKSTILKNITRKLDYAKGAIYIEQENIRGLSPKKIAKKMASLSQHQGSTVDFTVRQLIHYGRMPHKKWYEPLGDDDQQQINWAMDKTGVVQLADQPVMTLSGGERQRVWIAMTLAQNPKVLLLDEPTTYLDICHQLEILDLIHELNKELNMTVIMVLHDLNQACQYSHRVCVMKEGRIECLGKPQEIFCSKLIRDVYRVEAVVSHEEGKVHIRPMKVFKGGKITC